MFPDFDAPDYVDVLPASASDQLFEQADVVIVTLPLTSETSGSISTQQFNKMKKGSYFINVARGQIVDHSSLLSAIESEQIACACLDVVDPEPLPADSPLWNQDRIIVTPHVGAQSPDRVKETTELFCRNFARYRQGADLINLVDKQLQFPRPEHRLRHDESGRLIFPGEMP